MSLVAIALIALLVGTEAFFTLLSVLNLRHEERTVAAEREWVVQEVGVDDPEEMLDYHRAKTGLSLLRGWLGLAVLVLVLFSGLFADAVAVLSDSGLSPLAQGVVFAAGGLVAMQVWRIPSDLVETFVVEEIFGFNEQTPALWVRDFVVGLVVSLAIVLPLVAAVLWFVGNVPYWPAAAWALLVAFVVAFTVLKPRVIDPLFHDFTPIEDGDLRAAVEEVFERAGFSCEQVYEMDASRRSSHSNAYFIGFGRAKRVVLYDTLVDQMDTAEIQSVLAHELAHWKKRHVWKFIGLFAARFAVVFAVLGVLVGSDWLYAPFAVSPGTEYAGLFLALLWILPVNKLTAPLNNVLSLKYEREADRFAVETMDAESKASALATLASENLAALFPHPWYETFHYDHPPIPERIRYVREMGEREAATPDPTDAEAAD